MPTGIQKVCCVCGKDVSQTKRTKDTKGNYYCNPCWAGVARTPRPQPSVPISNKAVISPSLELPADDEHTRTSGETSRIEKAVPPLPWPSTDVPPPPARSEAAIPKTKRGRNFRNVAVAVVVLAVVVGGGAIWYVSSQFNREIDDSGRVIEKQADYLQQQSEASAARADQYRQQMEKNNEEIRKLRDGVNASPKTKSQRVEDDSIVQGFISSYPQFEDDLKHLNELKKQRIDLFCTSMVAAGKMDLPTVKHLRAFMVEQLTAPE